MEERACTLPFPKSIACAPQRVLLALPKEYCLLPEECCLLPEECCFKYPSIPDLFLVNTAALEVFSFHLGSYNRARLSECCGRSSTIKFYLLTERLCRIFVVGKQRLSISISYQFHIMCLAYVQLRTKTVDSLSYFLSSLL